MLNFYYFSTASYYSITQFNKGNISFCKTLSKKLSTVYTLFPVLSWIYFGNIYIYLNYIFIDCKSTKSDLWLVVTNNCIRTQLAHWLYWLKLTAARFFLKRNIAGWPTFTKINLNKVGYMSIMISIIVRKKQFLGSH